MAVDPAPERGRLLGDRAAGGDLASDATRTAGLTLSWRADQPAAETTINWIDVGSPALVAGLDVSAADPPRVTVSGDTVEVLATLHDPVLGGSPQQMRLVARCPAGRIDEPAPETEPVRGGQASVSIEGATHRAAGPSVSRGMTWAVIAYNADMLPIAASELRPISP